MESLIDKILCLVLSQNIAPFFFQITSYRRLEHEGISFSSSSTHVA